MQRLLLITFCALILFPISSGFSQSTDTQPTLSVVLTSTQPFVYTDNDGYTIVVGEVENKNELTSVTNVRIKVSFFNEFNSQLVEVVRDGPVMEVIPPKGKSPYIIKSSSPNPEITSASVTIEGFISSPSKSNRLLVTNTDIFHDKTLQFSGTLQNNGGAPITDAKIIAAFYDAFNPPRLVGVSTIDIGDVATGDTIDFNFDEKTDARVVTLKLFADSDVFYSNIVDIKIPQPNIATKLVTISDVSIIDNNNKISEIKQGSTVKIQSDAWIQFNADQESSEFPYTYYAQVKKSGEVPFVEFLGIYNDSFVGASKEFPSIEWTPENTGFYFIETFLWDGIGVPIADKGPITLVIVN